MLDRRRDRPLFAGERAAPHRKYNKPPQRPFTIIKPAEKAQLAIFYSAVKRADVEDRYISLQYRLGDIMVIHDLDPNLMRC
jgi:hypothetical protein